MKKLLFIADFFSSDINGGGENNDSNLINHLQGICELSKIRSGEVLTNMLDSYDTIIIGNFVFLSEDVKDYLIKNCTYIIYEHDHKYLKFRDPSRYTNFIAPKTDIINKRFYSSAKCVVVLSSICKDVLQQNIPEANIHNISCSLWSSEQFDLLSKLSLSQKNNKTCIMKSSNPTKNYHRTVEYCNKNDIIYDDIFSSSSNEFLTMMSKYKSFLFIPTVLETFSRVCAEAKMMNVNLLTNKNLIGFCSEEYSHLSGTELIEIIKAKNTEALKFFGELI